MKKLLVILLLTVGCGPSQLIVNYQSDPAFASIYLNGQKMGEAWVHIPWSLDDMGRQAGRITTQSVKAVWPSGATAESGPLLLDFSNGNTFFNYTFVRPVDYPNKELDIIYALEMQKLRLQVLTAQQAAEAANSARQAADSANFNTMMDTLNKQQHDYDHRIQQWQMNNQSDPLMMQNDPLMRQGR